MIIKYKCLLFYKFSKTKWCRQVGKTFLEISCHVLNATIQIIIMLKTDKSKIFTHDYPLYKTTNQDKELKKNML